MTLEWFKNPDHVVYVEKEKFVDNFAKETGIPNLRKEIEEFELRPIAEGKTVKGTRRTTLRLLIPNLMFGGDMPQNDEFTLNLLTNKEVIEVNQHSKGGKQIYRDDKQIVRIAFDDDNNPIIGIFNISDKEDIYEFNPDLIKLWDVNNIRDLWLQKDIGQIDKCEIKVNPHGARLLKLYK